jgi:hypothetical protein
VRLDFQSLDEDGLRNTLPRSRSQLGAVGVRTMFGARGDFEITVHYEILQAEKPALGWGAGVMMSLEAASQDSARIGRALDADDEGVFKWDHGNQKQTDDPADVVDPIPSKQAFGSLRFVRKGPTLRYYVAEGKDASFTMVHEEEFGSKNIDTIRVVATTDDQPRSIDVRLIDFDVKADQFLNRGSIAPTRGPSWPLLAALGLAVLSLGLYAVRRRRRAT